MGKKHETLTDPKLFYCFINIEGVEATRFRFFIVPSQVIATYVRDQHQIWLRADPSHKDSNIRVFRLAIEKEEHSLPTPMASRYENNWEFKQ